MLSEYGYKTQEWKEQLHNHLLKSEIQWVATHGGACVEFLKPYSGDIKTLKKYLNHLGFRIAETYETEGQWIRTTDGISISVDEDCFCVKTALKNSK